MSTEHKPTSNPGKGNRIYDNRIVSESEGRGIAGSEGTAASQRPSDRTRTGGSEVKDGALAAPPVSSPQKTPTARLNDLGTRLALLDQAAGVSMTTGRVQFGAAWDIAVEALVEARALVEQYGVACRERDLALGLLEPDQRELVKEWARDD